MNRTYFAIALALATFFAGSLAWAQSVAHERRSVRFDVHADLDLAYVYGVGGRIEAPITRDGILDRADDDLTLSFGADVFVPPERLDVWPLAALQWNFYVARHWSVFPEGGLAFHTVTVRHDQVVHRILRAEPYLGAGGRFHFTPDVALLARVSWPAGFQLGAAF